MRCCVRTSMGKSKGFENNKGRRRGFHEISQHTRPSVGRGGELTDGAVGGLRVGPVVRRELPEAHDGLLAGRLEEDGGLRWEAKVRHRR